MQYNILALQSISLNCDLFIKKMGFIMNIL